MCIPQLTNYASSKHKIKKLKYKNHSEWFSDQLSLGLEHRIQLRVFYVEFYQVQNLYWLVVDNIYERKVVEVRES